MVLSVVAIVFASAFTTQMVLSGQLPSAYDPGIKIEEAFKTSEIPILIEFYSDTCSSCRAVTPIIHDVYNQDYQEQLTLVMVDIEDPDGFQISRLFGVEVIPAVFVFDAKRMKKSELEMPELFNATRFKTSLEQALVTVKQQES